MPDMSMQSLPDSGISDQGGAAGGRHRSSRGGNPGVTEDALAGLPGPGKMKQMTKNRERDDADSGFIGSMVGSGVGVMPQQQEQQQEEQPQQPALRLRGARADDRYDMCRILLIPISSLFASRITCSV